MMDMMSSSANQWTRDAWRQNKMAAGCPEEEENVFMCAQKTEEGVTYQDDQLICYEGDMPP